MYKHGDHDMTQKITGQRLDSSLKVYLTWQVIQQMHKKKGRDIEIKHLINQSRSETVYRD